MTQRNQNIRFTTPRFQWSTCGQIVFFICKKNVILFARYTVLLQWYLLDAFTDKA